jgi:CheY-like chemotaxis protein
LILVEQVRRDRETIELLGMIRELPELNSLPVIALGDGDDPESKLHAHEDGADAFIALPERASELQRIGKGVARFWWDAQLSKSA